MSILQIEDFLKASRNNLLIDVRSESEFRQGHIPGAVSLPLFSDTERAEVGTLYKTRGKETAFLKGLEFAGPKMRPMAETALSMAKGRSVFVYCWRGGMRSGSVGWLLRSAGLQVLTLQKGYKSFRNYVIKQFEIKRNIKILGGKTGSGKTEVLNKLGELSGEQIIDLENLANHKGSAFGGLGQNEQPSQESFENQLGYLLGLTSAERPVWFEDESRLIGRISIPDKLWAQMRKAPVFLLQTDTNKRIERLTHEYGAFTKEELKKLVLKISKRLGGLFTADAIKAIDNGEIREAVRISLDYYDRSYAFGLAKRDPHTIFHFNEPVSDEKRAG